MKAVNRKLWAWAASCASVLIAGIVMVAAGHPGSPDGPDAPLIVWGVVFMLASVIVPVCAGILAAICEGVDRHHHWISQFPPEQQAAIRKAERAAAWGAAAAAAVALHEFNKRVGEKLSASVIGTGPPPGKAGAAMWQAKQRRRAEAETQ